MAQVSACLDGTGNQYTEGKLENHAWRGTNPGVITMALRMADTIR